MTNNCQKKSFVFIQSQVLGLFMKYVRGCMEGMRGMRGESYRFAGGVSVAPRNARVRRQASFAAAGW
jgi:hypothetical protein